MDKLSCFFKLSLGCLVISALPSHANDIAADVNGGNRNYQNGGYFEIGAIAGFNDNPVHLKAHSRRSGVGVDVDGSGVYRYQKFFAEAVYATQDGVNLGYNLWQNDNYSVDLLAGSLSGSYYIREDNITDDGSEEYKNDELYTRRTLHTGTGIRVTRHINNYVIQYRLVTDILDNNGIISTLRVGRGWQYRNWNFHGVLSAIYTSKETNQYRFGVDQEDATTRHPAFYPEASVSYSAQFGVTKPLSEHWVVRGIAGWEQTPDEIKPSNFVDEHDRTYLGISISRVFSVGK